jgi:hypothetical protein
MTSLLSLADEQAKPADSDFSSVYAKYQSALEKQNTEETLKYAELSYELGKSKFSGTPENLSNLKYNLAIALDEANKSPESFALFEEIKKEYANLYGNMKTLHRFFTITLHLGSIIVV